MMLYRYQGNISCKDGHKNDRNGMDLTEEEEIGKKIQMNYIKKILMTQKTTMVWSLT